MITKVKKYVPVYNAHGQSIGYETRIMNRYEFNPHVPLWIKLVSFVCKVIAWLITFAMFAAISYGLIWLIFNH